MKQIKKFFIGVFVILGMIAIPTAVISASLADEKAAAEQQIADFKAKIADAEGNLQAIKGAIDGVLYQIGIVQGNIDQINGEIGVIEENIGVKEGEIEQQLEVYNAKKQDFYVNLRNNYENGDVSVVEMVLDSSNLTDLINANEYYRIVKEQEENKIGEIKAAKEELERQKQELEVVKQELAGKKASLEVEQNQLAVEKGKLDSQKDYFASLSSQYQAELEKQEAALADINAQIQSSLSQGGNFEYTGSGQFTWPVPSSTMITSPFGYRTSPIFGGGEFHKGIDISGAGGAPIVAAESGVVVYAQFNGGGFGNCVVINHGSGLMTLYAHMSSISVSNGQVVSKGQTVGGVGSTGWSTGNHLHFQVTNTGDIYNGVVNPLNYL